MLDLAGVVDGHFDTTAGLVFDAEVSAVSFEKHVQEEEAEQRIAVFCLVPAIGGSDGLYCR